MIADFFRRDDLPLNREDIPQHLIFFVGTYVVVVITWVIIVVIKTAHDYPNDEDRTDRYLFGPHGKFGFICSISLAITCVVFPLLVLATYYLGRCFRKWRHHRNEVRTQREAVAAMERAREASSGFTNRMDDPTTRRERTVMDWVELTEIQSRDPRDAMNLLVREMGADERREQTAGQRREEPDPEKRLRISRATRDVQQALERVDEEVRRELGTPESEWEDIQLGEATTARMSRATLTETRRRPQTPESDLESVEYGEATRATVSRATLTETR